MLMTDKSKEKLFIGVWTETHHELTSESRLWKHVICQAISDSYLGTAKEKISVGEWILTEDFVAVCDLATLNSENLSNKIKEILTSKPLIARYLGERLKKVIQARSLNM